MIRSMTGFGRGETGDTGNTCVIEIKSVNNRFLEITPRFPRDMINIEPLVKEKVKKIFSRGSFNIFITLEKSGSATNSLTLNSDVAAEYLRCAAELKDKFGVKGEIDVRTLLNISGIITVEEQKPDLDSLAPLISSALDRALDSLKEMKEREGEAIQRDFEERLKKISQWAKIIQDNIPQITGDFQKNFRKKVQDALGDVTVDEARLAQEVVLWIDRGDITEELIRLSSHIDQFEKTISGPPPFGRKLEFILQEMGREANTIGSKANHPLISEQVVAIKCEFERLREQVLNVE